MLTECDRAARWSREAVAHSEGLCDVTVWPQSGHISPTFGLEEDLIAFSRLFLLFVQPEGLINPTKRTVVKAMTDIFFFYFILPGGIKLSWHCCTDQIFDV